MISVIYTVMCDRCNWWDDRTVGDTRAQAIRGARAAGMTVQTVAPHEAICAICSGKIKSPGAP